VIISLILMHGLLAQGISKRVSILKELKEGLHYVSHFVPVREILMLLALVSLVGMPYTVLMPVFAARILHGGPHTLGFMMAASGVGALIGALVLAARKSVLGLGRMICLAAGMFGAGLIGFSQSKSFWLSLLFLLAAGFGMMVHLASSNTILQTIVPDESRGRVMSYYTMAFIGMAPFGSLIAGSLANRIGSPFTVLISGICCVLGGLRFAHRLKDLRKLVRPIYVKMGIMPEMAEGIQAATDLGTPPEE
jgi:MFS family permease